MCCNRVYIIRCDRAISGLKKDTWFSIDPLTGTKVQTLSMDGSQQVCPSNSLSNIFIGRTGLLYSFTGLACLVFFKFVMSVWYLLCDFLDLTRDNFGRNLQNMIWVILFIGSLFLFPQNIQLSCLTKEHEKYGESLK